MPRDSLRHFGFSLRLGGLSLGLVALIASPVSCGLNAEGEQFGTGSNPSGTGGAGGTGVGGGSGGGGLCAAGQKQNCYSGPPGTEMTGACTPGVTTCNAEGTAWGPCEGEVVPATETCSTSVDDDCDGMVNEGGDGCQCMQGQTQPCYSGPMGTDKNPPCMAGTQTCNANGDGFDACMGEVKPLPEDCSTAADENCNAAETMDPPVADVAAGCVCIPGTTRDCYTGPGPTENVGICTGGTETCNPDGYGFGACVGEVTPGTEDCTTKMLDENCDGSSAEVCPGETHWSKRFGNNSNQEVNAVAVDGSGNVIIAGGFEGTIDLGGGTLTSAGARDIFIAKLGPTGTHLWSKKFGGTGNEFAASVAVNAMDEIVMVGTFDSSSLDFGGGARNNIQSLDGFAVKFDELGSHIWSVVLGSSSQQLATSVAVAPATGDVYVCGSYQGMMTDFGTGVLANGGAADYFLLRMGGGNGSVAWAKGFGDGGNQSNCSVAADGAGNVVMAMPLVGTVDFGGGGLVAGGADVGIAKFNSAGVHAWSKKFGDGNYQDAKSVAVDSANRVIVSGTFQGNVDFGSGDVVAMGSDAYVLKLAADGSYGWSKIFGVANDQYGGDVAVADADSIVVAGDFDNAINFGAPSVPVNAGGDEGYVVKLAANGDYVWSRAFTGGGIQLPLSVAADGMGNVFLGGYFTTAIDFGGGMNHPSQGNNDAFIAKLQK